MEELIKNNTIKLFFNRFSSKDWKHLLLCLVEYAITYLDAMHNFDSMKVIDIKNIVYSLSSDNSYLNTLYTKHLSKKSSLNGSKHNNFRVNTNKCSTKNAILSSYKDDTTYNINNNSSVNSKDKSMSSIFNIKSSNNLIENKKHVKKENVNSNSNFKPNNKVSFNKNVDKNNKKDKKSNIKIVNKYSATANDILKKLDSSYKVFYEREVNNKSINSKKIIDLSKNKTLKPLISKNDYNYNSNRKSNNSSNNKDKYKNNKEIKTVSSIDNSSNFKEDSKHIKKNIVKNNHKYNNYKNNNKNQSNISSNTELKNNHKNNFRNCDIISELSDYQEYKYDVNYNDNNSNGYFKNNKMFIKKKDNRRYSINNHNSINNDINLKENYLCDYKCKTIIYTKLYF